jgi:glyoxylase-like metal-dependent hydrolase (beta-lactamase superfamily II)
MDNYQSTKIAEHSWVVFGPKAVPNPENKGFMNNPAFLITDKNVVVIDPGSSLQVGNALLEKIREQTDKPISHVFISHVHGDHWLANHAIYEAYPEVKIYAHPVMIEEAKAGEAESWIANMKTLTEGATEGTKAIIPTIALEDSQEYKIDNITIKAHLNEIAHTKTDAMFEILEDKVLITGDNSFNERMPRLDDGSFTGNIKAMNKALSLNIDVVVPGHGPAGGKEILNNFRNFLSVIYDNSKIMMNEDMDPFEMKPIIVAKMGEFQSWSSFDDNIGRLISLAALEAENE